MQTIQTQTAQNEAAQHPRLSDLLTWFKTKVNTSPPRWVMAEIASIDRKPNYLSLELVEYDHKGSVCAKLRGSILKGEYGALERFEKHTDETLATGMHVLMSVQLQFHEMFGISCRVMDISPEFQLGQLSHKIHLIEKTLTEEGIMFNNTRLPSPFDFHNIAVIAPPASASLGDFGHIIDALQDVELINVEYLSANYQGQNLKKSILKAFDIISEQIASNRKFNAVIMIRGGGDKAGMQELIDIDIARAICLCPVPVIIGIGHERDTLYLDKLANRVCTTPTKVATHIRDTIAGNANRADSMIDLIYRQLKEQALLHFNQVNDTFTVIEQQVAALKTLNITKERAKKTARRYQIAIAVMIVVIMIITFFALSE